MDVVLCSHPQAFDKKHVTPAWIFFNHFFPNVFCLPSDYVIKVSTSRVPFAGTDARVYVNLVGVNGDSTGSIRLHNSIWDFEFGR